MANPFCDRLKQSLTSNTIQHGFVFSKSSTYDLENKGYYVTTYSNGVIRANVLKSHIKALHKKVFKFDVL